jgi:cobalt-zinc-cadmium efflux system membrane fusion protein
MTTSTLPATVLPDCPRSHHYIPAIVLVAAITLCGCSDRTAPAVAEPAAVVLQGNQLRYPSNHPQLALLKVADVRPSTAVAVELPARLVWNEARTQRVYAPLAGRVTAIRADVGQMVRSGSVLAQLASPELGQAQADSARANIDIELAKKTLARQRELLDAGVVARKDFDQAEADLQRATAEATRAQSRSRLYGGGDSVNQQLAITSGITGVVVERNINPGQELRPDQSGVGVPALFVVSDPTSLWVQIDARDSDLASLKPGAEFDLVVPALPNETFVGKVVSQSDAIDPATRTIKVRGEVANPARRLKAEMLANARMQRHLGGGLVIPASAVVLRGTRHVVYVQAAPGVFESHEVRLSYQDSRQAVVARGLEAGDKVVTENALLLSRQFALSQDSVEGSDAPPRSSKGAVPGEATGASDAKVVPEKAARTVQGSSVGKQP